MFTLMVVAMIAMVALAAGAAQPMKVADPKDRQIVDGFLEQVAEVPARITPAHCRAMAEEDSDETEAMTWRVMPYLRMPLTAYQLTGDPKYLDIFVQVFDNMRSALTVGPDGFLGWYGKVEPESVDPSDTERKVDAVISSFSATETVCNFLSVIATDETLSKKYAEQRAEYLDLIVNHLVKKHDVRGDYVDMGEAGAIYRMPAQGFRPDLIRLTMPHNKHSIIVRGLLALYRVTGDDEYMKKAAKIGTRFKRSLTLKDGHYEWNYWDPAGAWDVSVLSPARWKHWIGPEHRGGYYASSLEQALVLYDFGLVFDKTDMDRFLRTQLAMCWNGDAEHPQWSRVDGTRPPEYTQGAYMASGLAPFSEKVASFVFSRAQQDYYLEHGGDNWTGGPVLNYWLREKLIDYPAAEGGKQTLIDLGRQFLAKPDNREFLKPLTFEVTLPGYQAPMAPSDAKRIFLEPKR